MFGCVLIAGAGVACRWLNAARMRMRCYRRAGGQLVTSQPPTYNTHCMYHFDVEQTRYDAAAVSTKLLINQ